jgi:uncharacterized protein
MGTSVLAPSKSDAYQRIANPLHTFVVLAAAGAMAFRGAVNVNQMRTALNFNRVRMYERTIVTELVMLALVLLGVALAHSPLTTVLGEHWRSLRQMLRDLGIGIAFSIVSTLLLSTFNSVLHSADTDRAVRFILPHGRFEMALWVALSVTAGICEEAIYRGYLQRQFVALTKNAPIGILLQAAAFGLAHSYQGWHGAVAIAMEGALLGALAHWRKSVRPGMISHAWKDALAPLLMSLPKH